MSSEVSSNQTCFYITVNNKIEITKKDGLEYMAVFKSFGDADRILKDKVKKVSEETGSKVTGDIMRTTIVQCMRFVLQKSQSDDVIGGVNYITSVMANNRCRSAFIEIDLIENFREHCSAVANVQN